MAKIYFIKKNGLDLLNWVGGRFVCEKLLNCFNQGDERKFDENIRLDEFLSFRDESNSLYYTFRVIMDEELFYEKTIKLYENNVDSSIYDVNVIEVELPSELSNGVKNVWYFKFQAEFFMTLEELIRNRFKINKLTQKIKSNG